MKPLSTTVLALFAAALAASTGGVAGEITSATGEPSGVIRSGPINHAIVVLPTGTSLNIVSGGLDNNGPDDAS